MTQVKFIIIDESRIQKKYPTVRQIVKPRLLSNKSVVMETLVLDLNNENEKSALFSEPFVDIPAVSVTLLTNSNPVGSTNVYAYSVSKTGITVRTSADIIAQVSVQAIYIEP